MKKFKKRIVFIMIFVMMSMTVMLATACNNNQEPIYTSEGLQFTQMVVQGVTGYSVTRGTATHTHILIPEIYNDLPVVQVGAYSFYGFTELKSVRIAANVRNIGLSAFQNTPNLKNVTFLEGSQLTNITGRSFWNSGITEMVVPRGVNRIGGNAFRNAHDFSSITFVQDAAINDFGWSVFLGTRITNITIPQNVTIIRQSMFVGTRLTSMTIPQGVTTIENNAFSGVTSLKEVHIAEHSSLEYIGTRAFLNLNISSIHIPVSVSQIRDNAFWATSLTRVYYGGTNQEQWDAIDIEVFNDPLINATKYFYSTTQPADQGNFWRFVDGVPTAW